MNGIKHIFFLIACSLLQTACYDGVRVESISIDFPHGASRLLVRSNGEAFLLYGALPQHQEVRNNIFNVEELYRQLRPRLHENVPREQWPDPKADFGMVMVSFKDGERKDYLIFDSKFAEEVIDRARNNIVTE